MLNEAIACVKEFQQKANQTVRETPTVLTSEQIERRTRWITEELKELRVAKTIEDQADAVTDTLYYLLGFYVELGLLFPDDLFTTVHKANMRKLDISDVRYASDGKVLKPEGWVHPMLIIEKKNDVPD